MRCPPARPFFKLKLTVKVNACKPRGGWDSKQSSGPRLHQSTKGMPLQSPHTVSPAVIQERTRQQRKRPVRGTGPGAEEHWGAIACSAQRSATCPFCSEPPTLSLSSESLPPEKPEAYLSSGQLPILPCSYQLPDPSSGMSSVTYPLQPQPLGSPCPCCC